MVIFFVQWNYGAVKEKMPPALLENLSSIFDDDVDLSSLTNSEETLGEEEDVSSRQKN